MGGNLDDITADLKTIEEQDQDLGLYLNVEKSELIVHNQSLLMMSYLFWVTVCPCTTSYTIGLTLRWRSYGCLLGHPTSPVEVDWGATMSLSIT